MPRPRALVVSSVVPFAAIGHAGGRYVTTVCEAVASFADLTVIAPDTPANRVNLAQPGIPGRLLLAGQPLATSLPARAGRRLETTADRWGRRLDPGTMSLPLARALIQNGPERAAVIGAEVIDLQWSESIRLAPLIRRLNPRAHLIGTYHDVQSQLFARMVPVSEGRERAYWRAVAGRSRRIERARVRGLDAVVAFSPKDLHLLGDPPQGRVIHPALARGDERPRAVPGGPATVLFVAHFARDENERAANWLIEQVWPRVRAVLPDARLRLVGGGCSDRLRRLAAVSEGVVATGFVPDLGPEYASAHVCVVPLEQGAGVKFKTIEALLHDVPVVTTGVGAEGVDGPDLFAAVVDRPDGFAAAVLATLADPLGSAQRSARAQQWAMENYDRTGFVTALRELYRIDAARS